MRKIFCLLSLLAASTAYAESTELNQCTYTIIDFARISLFTDYCSDNEFNSNIPQPNLNRHLQEALRCSTLIQGDLCKIPQNPLNFHPRHLGDFS